MLRDSVFLDPSLEVTRFDGEGIVLASSSGEHALDDPLFVTLVDLLDHPRDVDELADLICAVHPATQMVDVYFAIEYLLTRGYLRASPAKPHAVAFAAGVHGVGLPIAREHVAVSIIDLAGRQDLVDPLAEILGTAGHDIVVGADVVVVIASADDLDELGQLTREGRTVLPVTVATTRLVLGPVYATDTKSPCPACLHHWLRFNNQLNEHVVPYGARGRMSVGRLLIDTTLRVFAAEIVRWLAADRNDSFDARVLTYEPTATSLGFGALSPGPGCVECLSTVQPAAAERSAKIVALDNGSRTETLIATLSRLQRHVNHVVGVLPNVLPVSQHPLVHAYVVGRNAALPVQRLADRRNGVRSQSGGKGRTAEHAKVSAICEGLERYAGVYQGTETSVLASYDDLGPGRAIHPDEAQLYSAAQFVARDEVNRTNDGFNRVPEPFADDWPIRWSELRSLDGHDAMLLPTSLCYYDFVDHPAGSANSNGVAAGTTRAEATLQGLLELIERDSVAIWWYNRLGRPAIDLDSFGDHYFTEIRAYYRSIDRDLWVLDVTSDLGVPSAVAVSSRREPPYHVIFGFGAHVRTKVAVERALTELNQFISAVVDLGTGAPRQRIGASPGKLWYEMASLDGHPYLRPDRMIGADEVAAPETRATIDEELDACLDRLARDGRSVWSLDLTRPEVDLAVVRVVVPGLRHFWARFAPGRLYDVPVALGLLDTPRHESELNPIAMFL